MTDEQLRDIAADLKRGLKPVKHKVEDSQHPPDFWLSGYTVEAIGPYPVSPFPTANDVSTQLWNALPVTGLSGSCSSTSWLHGMRVMSASAFFGSG